MDLKHRLRLAVDSHTALTISAEDATFLSNLLGPDRCEVTVKIGISKKDRRCLGDRGHSGTCVIP